MPYSSSIVNELYCDAGFLHVLRQRTWTRTGVTSFFQFFLFSISQFFIQV